MQVVRDCYGLHWSVSYICPTEGYPRGHVEVKCGQKTARFADGFDRIVAPPAVVAAVRDEWREGQSCLDVA